MEALIDLLHWFALVEALIGLALFITIAGALWAISVALRCAWHYWRFK